ncbi:MAG: hypothetical protein ACFFAO_03620 [Candidatus Hermodarchaeota archaeon]
MKLIVCSLIIGILFIILDILRAIITYPIFSAYSYLPIWNTPPNILAGMIFDLINGFIIVFVYRILYEGIPSVKWCKGLYYGIIIGMFRVVMMTFSIIVLYNVPIIYVIVSLITGYIEIVILGVITSIIYEKLGLTD